jgi:hypothetical protein
MFRRSLVCLLVLPFFLIACGGGDDDDASPSNTLSASPTSTLQTGSTVETGSTPAPSDGTPAGGTSGGGQGANLTLSGAATGTLANGTVTCESIGGDAFVMRFGAVGDYSVEINGFAGNQSLPTTRASVILLRTNPGVSQWNAGAVDGSPPVGSGTVTISPTGGQVDAELAGTMNATGTVRIQGSWSC